MAQRRERRRHQRERPSGGRIPVRHRAAGAGWQEAEALDIGAGGTFLIEATWPIGTQVELAIDVAERDGALILPGVVRWAAGDGSEHDEEAGAIVRGLSGVGVQFVGLDLDLVQELQDHLASLAPPPIVEVSQEQAPRDDDDDADVPATD